MSLYGTKTLIVVCKDEMYINQLRKLVETKDDEMQRDVAIGKAFCLPSIVQRVVPDRAAIDGDENVFTFGSANKAHMVAKPAFEPAALVIIGTRTLAAL